MQSTIGSALPGVYVHPVDHASATTWVGGTLLWAFAHVLPGAVVGTCNVCDGAYVQVTQLPVTAAPSRTRCHLRRRNDPRHRLPRIREGFGAFSQRPKAAEPAKISAARQFNTISGARAVRHKTAHPTSRGPRPVRQRKWLGGPSGL